MAVNPASDAPAGRTMAVGALGLLLALGLIAAGLHTHRSPAIADVPLTSDRLAEPSHTQSRWLGWSALTYQTAGDVASVTAFYQQALAAAGWRAGTGQGDWARGDRVLALVIEPDGAHTRVSVMVRRR